MLGLVMLGGWLRWRGRLTDSPIFLRLSQLTIPIGFVAVIAGWVTTEVGRQPWSVYGLMRTADSVSPSLTGTNVLFSLIAYMVVYLFMYPTGVLLMWRLVRKGPSGAPDYDATVEGGRPIAPVLAGGRIGGSQ
jgi:cytochrome d ubiquinol oxidase subunit I